METIKTFIKTRPKTSLLIMVIILAILKAMYPLFNKPLPATYYFGTIVDNWITFNPIWIVPYVTWYLFLPGVILLLLFRDKKACGLGLLTQILGLITCYTLYSIFQTTVPRPEVLGNDIFCGMVKTIYNHDQPYNAFPSIHVMGTFSLMLATAQARRVGNGPKITVMVVGVLIILSTVFVKQHVVLDILAGLAVASGYYLISRNLLNRFLSTHKEV